MVALCPRSCASRPNRPGGVRCGALLPPSRQNVRPLLPRWSSITDCPPRPEAAGSTTPSAKAAATAASTALPPLRNIADIERILTRIALRSARPRDLAGLRDSLAQLPAIQQQLAGQTDLLKGSTFVVSGVFETLSRTELKKKIEDNGGKVASSVSSKTTYLVAGDKMGPSKRTKAESLGVPIISEQDFLGMLE